jgi:ActR/RegA family two-component response regulator
VRNILLRGYYLPVLDKAPGKLLSDRINSGELTADELLAEYCSIVYSRTGSYVETAKILNLDRRTVKSKIEYLRSGGNAV